MLLHEAWGMQPQQRECYKAELGFVKQAKGVIEKHCASTATQRGQMQIKWDTGEEWKWQNFILILCSIAVPLLLNLTPSSISWASMKPQGGRSYPSNPWLWPCSFTFSLSSLTSVFIVVTVGLQEGARPASHCRLSFRRAKRWRSHSGLCTQFTVGGLVCVCVFFYDARVSDRWYHRQAHAKQTYCISRNFQMKFIFGRFCS